MKINLKKLAKSIVKVVANNPGKVKIAAAVLGVMLPAVATKALDLAEAARK